MNKNIAATFNNSVAKYLGSFASSLADTRTIVPIDKVAESYWFSVDALQFVRRDGALLALLVLTPMHAAGSENFQVYDDDVSYDDVVFEICGDIVDALYDACDMPLIGSITYFNTLCVSFAKRFKPSNMRPYMFPLFSDNIDADLAQ